MPVYDYHCETHGSIQMLRSIATRDAEARCPRCATVLSRLVSAPRLSLMSPTNRTAWTRNEQAAHEPRRVRRSACGHAHAAGETCRKPRDDGAGLGRGATGSRPWMLGH